MIISADMAIAIPIAMFSMLMLVHSISNSQSYYLAYARSSYLQIKYYSISQQMLMFIGREPENYSTIQHLSKFYNISTNIVNLTDYNECGWSFCRVIELNGATKILVIR